MSYYSASLNDSDLRHWFLSGKCQNTSVFDLSPALAVCQSDTALSIAHSHRQVIQRVFKRIDTSRKGAGFILTPVPTESRGEVT